MKIVTLVSLGILLAASGASAKDGVRNDTSSATGEYVKSEAKAMFYALMIQFVQHPETVESGAGSSAADGWSQRSYWIKGPTETVSCTRSESDAGDEYSCSVEPHSD